MAQITIRFKAVSLDVDTATKAINGMHVEYDLTTPALGTVPRVWDGVPSPGTAAAIWTVLRRFLGPMFAGAGAPPPDQPLPPTL